MTGAAASRRSDVGAMAPWVVRAPLMLQRWDTVGFVHWRFDRRAVEEAVPRALQVEEFDGSAWVGLTPFLVCDARPPLLPSPPSMRRYGETNLRTYVRGPGGRRGVWFFALDSSSVPACALGRGVYFQPYIWSDLSVEPSDGTVRYTGRRRWPHGGSTYDLTLRIGERRREPTTLLEFLTGRWLLFTRYGPVVSQAPISHQPWPLFDAEIVSLEQDLMDDAGLGPPHADPIAHFSTGVDARLGFPRPVVPFGG